MDGGATKTSSFRFPDGPLEGYGWPSEAILLWAAETGLNIHLPAPGGDVPLCLPARVGLGRERLHSMVPLGREVSSNGLMGDREGNFGSGELCPEQRQEWTWALAPAVGWGGAFSQGPADCTAQEADSWVKGSSQQRQQRNNWHSESSRQQPQPWWLPCVNLSLVFKGVALISAFWLLVPILIWQNEDEKSSCVSRGVGCWGWSGCFLDF